TLTAFVDLYMLLFASVLLLVAGSSQDELKTAERVVQSAERIVEAGATQELVVICGTIAPASLAASEVFVPIERIVSNAQRGTFKLVVQDKLMPWLKAGEAS